MKRMLCRNRVVDFKLWWEVFSSHAEAHRAAGLDLEHVWRASGDFNNVFFIFRVRDLDKAQAFIDAPEAADAAAASNVLEGEYHFLDPVPSY